MKRTFAVLTLGIALMGLLAIGCAQSAPAPAPTKAPAAPAAPTAAPAAPKPAEPTKAAAPAPTKAPAAAPTQAAAPAKKIDWPQKGKTITLVVPFTAGGGTDTGARLLAPMLEKELGVTVEVVNKTGAGSQVGVTELARAKPDGYTFGLTNLPTTISLYLDPARKAIFDLKSFEPMALHVVDPGAIGVKADSPYKTTKDLVDAAKANPGKLKAATTGRLSGPHLEIVDMEKMTGAKFAAVHFDGAPEGNAALLGGHVDVQFGYVFNFANLQKSGEARALGVMGTKQSKFLPGVTTMESQGYKLYHENSRGWSAPAGTPKEIVDLMSATLKKCMESAEHKEKIEQQGVEVSYMTPAEFAAHWAKMEVTVKELQDLAAKQ